LAHEAIIIPQIFVEIIETVPILPRATTADLKSQRFFSLRDVQRVSKNTLKSFKKGKFVPVLN
jgi:hypothetical protein